ncbi:MAG: TetR/AcrR family transcriptional regulator [Pseudonocardia sp.]|nr:TetR/AcrR family transcriptional regulator [Pseudonocardia sp.]
MSRPAGRPPAISLDDILAAGLEIGLEELSVAAVADRLGVTRTSVHRYVGSRRDLETLVGEHLVESATPVVDSGLPLEEYLLEFAESLVRFINEHPGPAAYYARGVPRTVRSARVVEAFVRTLVDRGLPPGRRRNRQLRRHRGEQPDHAQHPVAVRRDPPGAGAGGGGPVTSAG